MTRPLFYASADWHIPEQAGGGAWKSTPGVSGDSLFSLEQIVALCVRDGVPLMAAGDLIDGPDLDPIALADLYRVLRPIADNRLSILYILGNHDRSKDWLAAFGPAAVRLDDKVIRIPKTGIDVTGVSYTPPASFPGVLSTTAVTAVGLYHQTWVEWGPGKGISVSTLPTHTLAICGDVHVRGVIKPARGPVTALSPGPLAPQSVTEFDNPVVYAVGESLTPTPVKLRGRKYVRFEINSPGDADRAAAEISKLTTDESLPPAIRTPVVAIKLSAGMTKTADTFTDLAADRGVTIKITETASPTSEEYHRTVDGRSGLSAAVSVWCEANPSARRLALDVIAPGADPAEVFAVGRIAFESGEVDVFVDEQENDDAPLPD